jgi:hypothetical protein
VDPTKFNKSIANPNLHESDYLVEYIDGLCEKDLTAQSKFTFSIGTTTSVSMSLTILEVLPTWLMDSFLILKSPREGRPKEVG